MEKIEKLQMSSRVNSHSESKVKKIDTGTKRNFIQIEKTIKFEFSRNLNKLISMLITAAFIFLLSLLLILIQEYQEIPSPEDPVDYILDFLGFISLLSLVVAASFGGSIIAEDFEKLTGNLMFPKITRGRLLIGRLIARTIYASITIAFYYSLVAIATFLKYGILPGTIWLSMIWAIFYTFTLLCFTTFFSSIMNRSSTAMVMTILFVMMVFSILTMILMFTGITVEPLFMIDYYANIITNCFNMPTERFSEFSMGRMGGGGSMPTFQSWITPSVEGAIIGMGIYSAILLFIASIFYKRKQSEQ
ncbi:MAG: ABC transporter permease [archaeon]|nr:ABC transporter permease [archaeon]